MVDQGYRGHGYEGSASIHVVRSIPKRATRALRRMLKRRAAIEPTIGHLKSDNRLDRNYLTGTEGDKINALRSAAGYNLRKLLRWIVLSPIFWLWQLARGQVGRHRRSPPSIAPADARLLRPSAHLKIKPTQPADRFSGTTIYHRHRPNQRLIHVRRPQSAP